MSLSQRAADAEARRLAQTCFDRPLVLEAGAGTGKTATLVARVLSWCLGPGWEAAGREVEGEEAIARRTLEGVVAITFTEAASAEMAERVGEALAALERGDRAPPGLDLSVLEPSDASLRSARARALLSSLDRLTVRTIHSFCLRLLAEHPLEARLPPRFEVDAEGTAVAELAREAVEETLRDESPVRQALLELAVREVQPETVVDAIVTLTREGVPVGEIARERYPEVRLLAMQRSIHEGLFAFLALEGGRLRQVPRSHTKTLGALDACESLVRIFDEGLLERGQLAAMLEAHAAPARERLRLWGLGEFNPTETKKLGEDVLEAQDAIAEAAAALDELVRARLSVLDPARAALAPLVERTRTRLHESGLATYSDLLRLARDLLRDDPAVRAQERRRLRQLLVDEFQDTDRVQCELVELLGLPDGSGEPAPCLFLVGDPKQSIYGWRSADLAAYDEFKERVVAAGGAAHPLHVNFRSVPAILAEVERVVKPVMVEEARVQPPFEALLACESLAEEKGCESLGRAPVEHWDCRTWERPVDEGESLKPAGKTSAGRAAEIEAAAIARDIVELHLDGDQPWEEFAILLRTGTHQETFLRALRERGIPFEVGKDKSYYRRREVIDAGALVRAVLDPHDHLALLTWLRSPSVGVPDCALLPLWTRDFPELCTRLAKPGDESARALADIVAELPGLLDSEAPGLEAIAGWELSFGFALEVLARLRAAFEEMAADRFVELLRSASGIEGIEAARWLGSYRSANLDRFFRELEEELLDSGTTRHDVLRRLRRAVAEQQDAEEGRPRQERSDAVQIMSIHAAKGLDFGQVYLPRLDNKGRDGQSDATAAALVGGKWELRLFKAETVGWPTAAEAAVATEQAERVRLLYVAVTRAKRRLVFSGMERAPKPPAKAKLTAELVGNREGGITDWAERAAEAGSDAQGRWAWSELDALWSVCDLAEREESLRRAKVGDRVRLPAAAEVAGAAQALRTRRAAASKRSARPSVAAASGLADEASSAEHHEAQAERLLGGTEELPAADREGEGSLERLSARPPTPRGAAMAAGTAVHRLLETLDLDSEASAFRAAADDAAAHARVLASDAESDAAESATRELLERMSLGPCVERLLSLGGEGVLARELPVLLEPSGEEGPVGCFVGSIDLIYRDPTTSEIVVADHKSDRVESEDEIVAAIALHRAQLEVYRRAVELALRLETPPRAELWLLWPGRIVEVPEP